MLLVLVSEIECVLSVLNNTEPTVKKRITYFITPLLSLFYSLCCALAALSIRPEWRQ